MVGVIDVIDRAYDRVDESIVEITNLHIFHDLLYQVHWRNSQTSCWEFLDLMYSHIGKSQTLYILKLGIFRLHVFSFWKFPDLILGIPRPHIFLRWEFPNLILGIPRPHIFLRWEFPDHMYFPPHGRNIL